MAGVTEAELVEAKARIKFISRVHNSIGTEWQP